MASTKLDTVYATDEDVFVVGGADWATIVPRSNLIASGSDGIIASNNLWKLTSATNAFVAAGTAAGHVLRVSGPASRYVAPQYFAVETVGSNYVTIRRPGMGAGEGLPPAPGSGLTDVVFEIATLAPQIESAAFDLNEQFSVDPRMSGRKPSDIYDQRIFRRLNALLVLYRQYENLTRTNTGDFDRKVARYKMEYDDALSAARVRWGADGSAQPSTGRFSMRLTR